MNYFGANIIKKVLYMNYFELEIEKVYYTLFVFFDEIFFDILSPAKAKN